MAIAVIAEKPSVGRDLARVLGARKKGRGLLAGGGYVVTWAVGHLVALAEPHQIDPRWKRWRREQLPMLPKRWPLVVVDESRDQFDAVQRVLNDPAIEEVICATDAGREGELIFRYIYEAVGCRKPVRRLWISSLTPEAIREGFRRLRSGRDFDGLADAARGRSRADWLVGMNLSRAYSLAYDEHLSVGRVQTPTLAMIVERERAIRDFVSEDYLQVVVRFACVRDPAGRGWGPDLSEAPLAKEAGSYEGTWVRTWPVHGRGEAGLHRAMRLSADGTEAAEIIERAPRGDARVRSVNARSKQLLPPLLYDLTELQRHANRLFGLSAQQTSNAAQSLYERHKAISYPRTDCRHLSSEVARTLGSVVRAIEAPYRDQLAPGTGERPLGPRFVDDAKLTDHHAIIPTTVCPRGLGRDEQRIYDLVCRRLLMAWHEAHRWSVTTVITAIEALASDGELRDLYHSSGKAIEVLGWKVLDLGGVRERNQAPRKRAGAGAGAGARAEEKSLPAGLVPGLGCEVEQARAEKKRTRPPSRHTEATLLGAMETAGRLVKEDELSRAMKDRGLGTPATRAAIIETLIKRDYMQRQGKMLEATDMGMKLIEVVHPEVKSPALTGEWEAALQRVQRGEGALSRFMEEIEAFVRRVVEEVGSSGHPSFAQEQPPFAQEHPSFPKEQPPRGPCQPLPGSSPQQSAEHRARPGGDLLALLRERFGLETFRPNQEHVCQAVCQGRDGLLVMPTGAGKSLCYQLPGIARGGCTLVISPLIALMEDQVQALCGQGLAAERIHSGRDRLRSREVCRQYLNGELDFLFIAPERLGGSGFPEFLARRMPVLIAVDEAHCISHWGHDFRPDYRMLRERLLGLRPVPIIALTATATPRVQDDIVEQLGLADAERFIHGFRRSNLAIEVAQMVPSARPAAVENLLEDPALRPALVYAPSRKQAESLAELLVARFPAAPYHAGLPAARRDETQAAFLDGRLEVIVATIAFGMGIDKPDLRTVVHVALPGSLEGYYQEIGRAGRDGKPARAVLLHSFVDRRTHAFFHEKDYPDPDLLQRVLHELGPEPLPREELQHRLGMDPETIERALDKLWVHGGVRVDPEDRVWPGREDWRPSYEARRDHHERQVQLVGEFAQASGCRMLHLVRHFGDQADDGSACGICDICASGSCLARRWRKPEERERRAMERILASLSGYLRGTGAGRLFREVEGEVRDRRSFQLLLDAMIRGGLVHQEQATFTKDGREISYQQVSLCGKGWTPKDLAELQVEETVKAPGRKGAKRRATKRTASSGAGSSAARRSGRSGGGAGKTPKSGRSGRAASKAASLLDDQAAIELFEGLRKWRLGEARRRHIPAFRILTDRVLTAIAVERPQDMDELLAIRGIGPTVANKYGDAILKRTGG